MPPSCGTGSSSSGEKNNRIVEKKMAIGAFEQPELIEINNTLRLRKFDGRYELFLPGYQNSTVYQNSEGIIDESKIPDLAYVEGMCKYLVNTGELYHIEVKESGNFVRLAI